MYILRSRCWTPVYLQPHGILSPRCWKMWEILLHIAVIPSLRCCTSVMQISHSTTSQKCSIRLNSGCFRGWSTVNSLSLISVWFMETALITSVKNNWIVVPNKVAGERVYVHRWKQQWQLHIHTCIFHINGNIHWWIWKPHWKYLVFFVLFATRWFSNKTESPQGNSFATVAVILTPIKCYGKSNCQYGFAELNLLI